MSRIPMTERTFFWRFATAAHRSRAANEFSYFSICRILRLKPTLVVKISDTSLTGKAGSNPALGVTYRGSGPAKAVESRAPVLPKG